METEIFYKALGKRIKELRKEHGFTQEILGEKIGVTKSAIVNYETGIRKIPLDTLVKISQLFDIKLDTLIGKERRLEDVLNSSLNRKILTEEQENLLVGFLDILLGVNESGESNDKKQKQRQI